MAADKSNRSRILEEALRQFNRDGAAVVSTNHIAAALEVSPGNLYYHFRNKQEIILELYRSFLDEYEQLWSSLARGPLGLLQIADVIVEGFTVNWKYRFIATELGALCQADPQFAALQQQAYEGRYLGIVAVIRQAAQAGVFQAELDEQAIEDIVHIEWMINQYWVPYVTLQGSTPTMADMFRGARLGLRAMEPYLLPQYRQLLFEHLAQRVAAEASVKPRKARQRSPRKTTKV
ncbi:MAG: TetR/AcrR family transcriptional regulator [Myxococcota bacterium]|jgi:AcrR family transcriptional regulator|nr:TetR/AcrR family transcriptional regulator [Myxococcota bacterium]